jgi:hypothetical protein
VSSFGVDIHEDVISRKGGVSSFGVDIHEDVITVAMLGKPRNQKLLWDDSGTSHLLWL